MKTGSKRGAALAYVIVVSAALMILASALVFSAKFNLDSATNSLEGRQAYLDAKSAIEYGRAYVLQNPDAGSFTVLKTSEDSGFKIGSGENAVAEYDSTRKLIKASAKYRSSDRVRKLGYQFTTEEGGEDALAFSDFVALGSYGNKNIVDDYGWPRFGGQKVTSSYPVLFNRTVHLQSGGLSTLTAPAVFLMGSSSYSESLPNYNDDNAWSFQGDWGAKMELNTPFLYISNRFYSQPTSVDTDNTQMNVYGEDTDKPCFVYFSKECKIYVGGGSTLQATIPSGLYKMKPGTNIFKLKQTDIDSDNRNACLTEASNEEIQTYQNYIDYGNNIDDVSDLFSGDAWSNKYGVQWTINGALKSGFCSIQANDQQNPEQYIWTFDKTISGFDKKVYFYVNDCLEWGSSSTVWRLNTAKYIAREINFLYVNASTDFKIPEYKTVVFKADGITLNTRHSDTEVGSGDSQPKITHSGSTARFILEAQDPSDDVQLHVPSTLQVQYKDQNGIVRKYQIKAGWYEVQQLNLFSDDAKDFFNDTEPGDGPSGGSGSGGGGTEITGGVYTDGE